MSEDGPRGKLFYGDCLTIVRDHIPRESVDLIYLDPPFNSQRQYNSIYKDETGRPLPDQVEAFCDMWEMDGERERVLRSMPMLLREAGVDDSAAEFWRLWLNSLRYAQPSLLAYLIYMVERMIYLKAALRPDGSIFLHCDPTASHYIKVMMDAIFGHRCFRGEIIWKRFSAHNDAKLLGAVHDTILYYSVSDSAVKFNRQFVEYDPAYVAKRHRHSDPDGRAWMDGDLTAKGLSGGGYEYEYEGISTTWRVPIERMIEFHKADRLYFTRTGGIRIKRYLDEMPGVPLNDIWTDVPPINSRARERMGYATQKPVKLLERIIEMSSNPDDVVLDPFCGCGTTLEAAHNLGRRWIGIDIAIHAVKRVSGIRLEDRAGLKEGPDFTIEGVPHSAEGAQDLWERDKYHFQKWAVEQVDGFVTSKRTADGGIDGRLYFAEREGADLQSMIIEVKGGKNVGIGVLRALRGVLEDEAALMAGLIIMEPLGATKQRNFDRFMAEAGDLDVLGVKYARMQMLTVDQILSGTRFLTPSVVGRREAQQSLPLGGPGQR